MDTTRRGFLKLLGFGAAGAAVGAGSLFTATPGQADLMINAADHYVFDRSVAGPRLTPEGKAHFLWKVDPLDPHVEHDPVTRILLKNPKYGRRSYVEQPDGTKKLVVGPPPPWSPSGDPSVYQADCPVREGEDPHVAFFMASAELQRQINDDVQEFAKALRRFDLVMITAVDVPIMAFPHAEQGFYLETQISQYAAKREDIENIEAAISTRGEVPVETPDNVSFKFLIHMEDELKAMGLLRDDRNAHLTKKIADEAFRRVWGNRAGVTRRSIG